RRQGAPLSRSSPASPSNRSGPMGDWQPDVLGGDWVARTLRLHRGEPGSVATLVRRRTVRSGRAMLHVHGYVDYFFQTHLADAWEALGYDVYALDLRAHGRSMRPGGPANYVTDLAHHTEEL